MSTISASMKIHNDENNGDLYTKVKKTGGDAEVPKRAALGQLQNRVPQRSAIGKDAVVQKNLKDAKLMAARASVKPRVDSHWKKGTFPTTTANSPTKTTATTITTTATNLASVKSGRTAAVLPSSRVLTRSNSVRLRAAITTATTTANVLPTSAAAAGNAMQRQGTAAITKEIKTVTTKMVENKVQQVKLINKEKPAQVETKLRREDSNLSRKSLTKLKAALAREVKVDSKTLKGISSTAAATITTTTSSDKAIKTIKCVSSQLALPAAPIEKETRAINEGNQENVPSKSALTAVPLKKKVRDIDEGDQDNLILVSEYVNDIYEYLFQLEIEQPILRDHLKNQQAVTPKMRAVLIDWINEVHSQFHLVPETFHMTVAIIDRYLQKVNDTKRSHLQLVGVTALFLAAKYEELYPPAMGDFIYMTDHSYSQQQILEMEIQIFQTLDCNLSRPVSIHFLRRFSKAADIEDFQHAMSKYFLELAAIEYELASYKPSEIAAASLFLSLHMSLGDRAKASGFNDTYWNATLEHYSHYDAKHLRPITRQIASIARKAPEEKLNAVYTKYQSSKFYKASLRPVLYSALMDSIIQSNAS